MPRTEGSLARSGGVLAVSRNLLRNRINPVAGGPDPELADLSEKIQGVKIGPPLKIGVWRGEEKGMTFPLGFVSVFFRVHLIIPFL